MNTKIGTTKIFFLMLINLVIFGYLTKSVLAQTSQTSQSSLYVPLIGVSSVPDPLALPNGPGNVTYRYAVKNFLSEYSLTDVSVSDDKCSPAKFIEGDDNNDGKLDVSETWRYTCTTKLSVTTQSIVTAIGTANNLSAAHKAYATVVVGSNNSAPLVNIINITKVAYPITLPVEGGDITFTYRVNNPGAVSLSNVSVADDKCSAMSSKLGDTNGNSLLDTDEVWVYTCTTHLNETTTNTVSVMAFANNLKAVGYATITVTVAQSAEEAGTSLEIPSLPNTGVNPDVKIFVWAALLGILLALLIFFFFRKLTKKNKTKKTQVKTSASVPQLILIPIFLFGVFGVIYYALLPSPAPQKSVDTSFAELAVNTMSDESFGWKYPTVKFPITGVNDIAYSDIRDPGGVPQGLPVRLKIPVIGVDTAIEDALITPDGRMDVPSGSVNVAWFALGPHPGNVGSAVIGGHFGIRNGVPFVFYKLDTLKVGDKIYIVNDKGDTLAFIVRSIKLFDRNADATTVFTSDDGLAHLNIITCEGIWNQVNGSYPERRVVFADAIPAEGAVIPKATAIDIFPRSLAIGMKGEDVAALQTALEQKGFLTMPRGIAKGYFGSLTHTAVVKYQKSVGLTPNGLFSTLTKARLVSEPIAVAPTLPSTAFTTPEASPAPASASAPAFLESAKSLYATPVNGLVTSLLVLSIAFAAWQIIRR